MPDSVANGTRCIYIHIYIYMCVCVCVCVCSLGVPAVYSNYLLTRIRRFFFVKGTSCAICEVGTGLLYIT